MKIDRTLYRRDLFSGKLIAMEAGEMPSPEDITATTDDMMKRAAGKNADTGDLSPDRTSQETQDANAADTQRGAMSDNLDAIDPAAGGGEGGDDMGMGDDGGGDMGDMGGGEGGGDMGDMGGETEDTPTESPEQAQQILKLQKNMSAFYRALNNTYETLGNYIAPASTPELRKVYNAAMEHLASAKELLFDMLSTKLTPDNYAERLRKYIALRHVYSAVLEMLELHFKVLEDA